MTLLECTIPTRFRIDEEQLSKKELERMKIIQIIHESEKYWFKPKILDHKYELMEDRSSGIGAAVILQCKTCKKFWDLTDYERW